MTVLTDIRPCEECGTSFVPRREHARFCSAGCRAAWTRERVGELAAEESALLWCLTAMADASDRLGQAREPDPARASAVIAEVVWWITIVDATLVRHHPEAYDVTLVGRAPRERRLIEETLGGLRFVRNRIGEGTDLAELVQPRGAGTEHGYLPGWTWRSVPEPALDWLAPRGRAWELTRYRAYQAQLAGHSIGQSFDRTSAFLKLAAATTPELARPSPLNAQSSLRS